jgi:phospholipase/lecithinase/hemolysin
VISDYNTKLAAAVSAFQANHTGVSTYLFDAHSAFTTILNNPSKYGFTSVTAYGQTGDFWG